MKGRVAYNNLLSEGYYRLRLILPVEIKAVPGQFVMVKVSESGDPFLPRPFSIAFASENRLDVIYKVKGKGTGILARLETGDEVIVTGPLGNGFSFPSSADTKVIMVAGGVGIPPLYFLLKSLIKKKISRKRIYLFYGAKNKDSLLLTDELEALGINLFLSTDDGSYGSKGLITDFYLDRVKEIEPPAVVYTVGPNVMMSRVVEISRNLRYPVEVSLETHMACGIGVCLGCTVKPKEQYFTRLGYLKVCKDGPVFPGEYFF